VHLVTGQPLVAACGVHRLWLLADYPRGAFDASHNGGGDAFVTKLDGSRAALSYSAVLGGTGSDVGNAIVVDGDGKVAYVTGSTESGDDPTTDGAHDSSYNGGGNASSVRPLDKIGRREVEGFIAEKLGDGLAPKSVRNYLGFLHSVFAYAHRQGLVARNPWKEVALQQSPAEDAEIRFRRCRARRALASGSGRRARAGRPSRVPTLR
jgi:hypothetical protein